MEARDWASLVAVVVAALAGYAAQRAAANASARSAVTTSRTEIEKDAYVRAESYLTGTITRQDTDLVEMREEISALRKEVRAMFAEMAAKDEQIRLLSTVIAQRGEAS